MQKKGGRMVVTSSLKRNNIYILEIVTLHHFIFAFICVAVALMSRRSDVENVFNK